VQGKGVTVTRDLQDDPGLRDARVPLLPTFVLRVLGPFELSVDGVPVKLSRRPRAALVALVLRCNELVSTDSLIDAVWNGAPPASSRNLLHLYLSQIRRALPPGRLVTERGGYRLVVDAEELDARRFERLLADGSRALAEGADRVAEPRLAAALALWRGEPLTGLDDDPAVRDEAARLGELRLVCIERRFDALLRLGRDEILTSELRVLVAEHPLREHLRAQLMTALYRSGRQADALACYREGRDLLVTELGLEPGPELRALERQILEHDHVLVAPDASEDDRRRVPAPLTPTIGRERELAELRELLLDPRVRLVTLTGPGGIGKTRLAAELASATGDGYAGGAALVDLTPLADPDDLLSSIGRSLGLLDGDASGWHDLLARNLGTTELLVVLDNAEHLVEGADVLVALLDAAPRLTIVVTSRRVLRLSAEHVVEVRPLELGAATELLVSRAVAAGAGVDAGDPAVPELCERLDRIPLALELAAPSFRKLPPGELLRRLDSRLTFLVGGPRDAPDRQRTMRATIDWGVDLLGLDARHLLGRLALFRRPFSAEAAVEVGGPDVGSEALDELIESSIVQANRGELSVLEVVREYAASLPSYDRAGHALHASYFLGLGLAAAGELAGTAQGSWLAALEASHDDLRAALSWFASEGENEAELRLACALGRFWYIRGYLDEGLERLQGVVKRAGDAESTLVADALRSASALAVLHGDYVLARDLVEGALRRYRNLNDQSGIVRSLSNLGAILHGLGEFEEAAQTLDECIDAGEALGESRLVALARNNRGDLALTQQDLAVARREFELSLALLREADDVANVARSLYNLGAVALREERERDACGYLVEALELSDRVDDKEDVVWCLIALSAVSARRGPSPEGARALGFAQSMLSRINATVKPNERLLFDETTGRLLGLLGRTRLDELLAEGAALPHVEAIALARSLAR
jgi:predicted ATPase/DNA-binding SARP family transcriptional activator